MLSAKIMIVEDERVVSLHLKRQLTKLGYEVVGMATDGARALQQILTLRPDIVLMDIHIEGQIDGIETAARIPEDLQIPVIYLTAYAEEPTLERARQTKPYGYLLKPFSEQELHASIQMILERRSATMARRATEQRLERLVQIRTEALAAANRELHKQTEERLKAERTLHQAQKMEALGQLTGGIAHDFNNDLTVILGSIEAIQRSGQVTTPMLQSALGAAARGAERAATLISHLLAFARKQPLHPGPIDLAVLIAGLHSMLRRTLGEMVTVRIVQGADCQPVFADANQLETALINLALNARDAMTDGGTLTLETATVELDHRAAADEGIEPGRYGLIAVTDTGTGMSREVLGRIFEPFFTTKDTGKGTGLGLSQVYGFATQSGGHVRAQSTLGAGTTMKLYLPLTEMENASAPHGTDARTAANGTDSETILVVEDNEDVRACSVGMLRELGYRVVEAPDGPAALEKLDDEPHISLLFTDVGLPGMNGRELADAVVRRRPDIPVVFTSGYEHDTIVHRGRLDPGVELLSKPFSYRDLGARIRFVLDK